MDFSSSLAQIRKDAPSGGDVHVSNAGAEKPTKRRTFKQEIAAMRKVVKDGLPQPARIGKLAQDSLYVRRNLKNAADLHTWAKGAGVPNLVPPEEMHVTQVYSRAPVKLSPKVLDLSAEGGERRIAPLGDKGAVVLHFESDALQRRFAEAAKAGASWDHDGGYKPHVTLTYDIGGVDIGTITPPSFPLIFGPEIHAPINEKWAEEKGFRKFDIRVPISKTEEEQRRVFGWASIVEKDGDAVIDVQGDWITSGDLEEAFYDFVKSSRDAGEGHAAWGQDFGTAIECMVFTKEKQEILKIDLGFVGAWIGFELSPQLFAKVKDGAYPAFSIGGAGLRIPDAA